MGLTIVDSLDTLLINGLMDEYAEARHWVANYFDMNKGSVSVSPWTACEGLTCTSGSAHGKRPRSEQIALMPAADATVPMRRRTSASPISERKRSTWELLISLEWLRGPPPRP